MKLTYIKKFFDDSVIVFKTKKFKDKRGLFFESYNEKELVKIGISEKFVQDNTSYSESIGTIRGLHFQKPPSEQAKLIRVNNGKIQDVIVDLRKNSKTFGDTCSIILSEKEGELAARRF